MILVHVEVVKNIRIVVEKINNRKATVGGLI